MNSLCGLNLMAKKKKKRRSGGDFSAWIVHLSVQYILNNPSRHLRERAVPWSAVEILHGKRQSVTCLSVAELLTMASSRRDWKRNSTVTSLKPSPPSPLPDKPIGQRTEMNWTDLSSLCRRMDPSQTGQSAISQNVWAGSEVCLCVLRLCSWTQHREDGTG